MYQKHDNWITYDTHEYKSYQLRGRMPTSNSFGSFIGAAQGWGRYVEKPYPQLVCDDLGIECLNLSVGGAGPEEPLFHDPQTIEMVNKSQFCVIQIMSIRSCSNDLFKINSYQNGRTAHCDNMEAELFWKYLYCTQKRESIERSIDASKMSFYNHMRTLINKIKVPKLLFYFSYEQLKIDNRYERNYDTFKNFLGPFPQLFDKQFLDFVKINLETPYLECITNIGLPQKLPAPVSDGYQEKLGEQPIGEYNTYYPSPEMHYLAKEKIINGFLHNRSS